MAKRGSDKRKGPREEQSLKQFLQPFVLEDVKETGETLSKSPHFTASKVHWRGTVCIANKLTVTYSEEVGLRLEAACRMLYEIRHPNLVQFLGVTAELPLPGLVSELLDTSVAGIIESRSNIPLPLQLRVLVDVAQGLSFLHSCRPQAVVHGHLTAKSVLLTDSLQAKIADLGVARILLGEELYLRLAREPDGVAYLPPEALRPSAKHSTGLDVFSFGVLALHLTTCQLPLPAGEPNKDVTEVDRRKAYFEQVGSSHCLRALMQQCLHAEPKHRPPTKSLLDEVTKIASQHPVQYKSVLDLLVGFSRRESELLATADQLEQTKKQLEDMDRKSVSQEGEIALLRDQVDSLEEHLSACLSNGPLLPALKGILQPQSVPARMLGDHQAPVLQPTQPEFCWKRDADMPLGMHSFCSVVLDGRLYVGGGECRELFQQRVVYEYDYSGIVRKWTALPPAPVIYFSLAVANKTLVLIGGVKISTRKTTGQMTTWDGDMQQWTTALPPMPTPRQSATAASHELQLLVAGGYASKRVLSMVEMFDMATFQWQQLRPLPLCISRASSCIINQVWYLMGGELYGESGPENTVFALPLSQPNLAVTEWSEVPSAPLTSSAAVACRNFVLSVGGCCPGSKVPKRSMYVYLPNTQQWHYVGEMPTSRAFCGAVVMHASRLMVLGGKEESVRCNDFGFSVEVLCL